MVSDWKLERFALGELPADELEALREGASTDPDLEARVEALEASNAEILDRYRSAPMARAIEHRLAEHRKRATGRRLRGLAALAPIVAAAVIAIVVLPTGERTGAPAVAPPIGPQRPEVIIPKGPLDAKLLVFRKANGESVRLRDGDPARAGDVLQLRYKPAGNRFGVILSVDGRGQVTEHFSGELARAGGPLDHAYELDDAPRFERFFLVASPDPIDMGRLLDAAEDLAGSSGVTTQPLPLGGAHEQTSVLIQKVSP